MWKKVVPNVNLASPKTCPVRPVRELRVEAKNRVIFAISCSVYHNSPLERLFELLILVCICQYGVIHQASNEGWSAGGHNEATGPHVQQPTPVTETA